MSTVFHIGFRKTGTSTLQEHFFPRLEGWSYVGPGIERFAEFNDLTIDVLWTDESEYDDTHLRKFLEEARGANVDLVVSREQLSTFHRGGRVAHRLHAVAPDAKIIICVRNQRTMLASAYSQHVRNGGTRRFADWVLGVCDNVWLHGDVVVQCYQELFGRSSVKVALYEDLVADESRFLGDLYSFMTSGAVPPTTWSSIASANPSLSRPSMAVLRQVNRVAARFKRFPRKRLFAPALGFLDRTVFARAARGISRRDLDAIERLLPRYAESNARLAELTGLDLASYRYPLPSGDPGESRAVKVALRNVEH